MKKSLSILLVAIALFAFALLSGLLRPQVFIVPAALAVGGLALWLFTPSLRNRRRMVTAVNIGEGVWPGGKRTLLCDAAIATRFLLVKFGTDEDHLALAGANDKPLGICPDSPATAGDPCSVQLLGLAEDSQLCICSENIAITDELYTAAGGKVQNLPAGAGTYYKVGRPLRANADGDGGKIPFEPCFPVAVVVP